MEPVQIFKKETFLKVEGKPTLQLKDGKVIASVLFIEGNSQEEVESADFGSPTTMRHRKTYEFTLAEYEQHGDDVWMQGIAADPQLASL